MQTSSKERIAEYNALGWWDNRTLDEIFREAVEQANQREALIDPPNRSDFVDGEPRRLAYCDLERIVDHIGSWMFENGLRQGDVLLVQMPNTVEIVLVYLAAARLGVILSPVAVQYGRFELDHIKSVIAPKAYMAFRNFRGQEYGVPQSEILDQNCKVLLWGEADFSIANPAKPDASYLEYVQSIGQDANDIFTICWTSGTTGRSKGVPRSHNQWLASALACGDSANLPDGSIFLNPFPFINMAAIGGFLYFWLLQRGTMVLHHPFDPAVFLSQIQDEKVVYTLAPPALLNRLIDTREQIQAAYDLSQLKLIGSGSAPLSPHMIEGFKAHFDIDVINVFGSNEGSALLSGPRDVPDTAERALFFPRFGRVEFEWPNRISSRLQTKLIDIETGEEITEADRRGELCIRGATVFDGYFKSPEDNAQAFTEDHFFRTGDLFKIGGKNAEFYCFVGRCKALIVRGGVNISPEELDETLSAHPDILEAAVAGYPDKIMGEKICAYIVPMPGKHVSLDDIKTYLEGLNMAKFKWPEKLQILEALPRNPMNKVVRTQLSAVKS